MATVAAVATPRQRLHSTQVATIGLISLPGNHWLSVLAHVMQQVQQQLGTQGGASSSWLNMLLFPT